MSKKDRKNIEFEINLKLLKLFALQLKKKTNKLIMKKKRIMKKTIQMSGQWLI